MVDSVSNTAISTLLRAQSVGLASNVSALRPNQQTTQKIIDQLQSGPDKTSSQSVPLQEYDGASTLPRGSLVNMLI
jgi:hypothetical protein